MVNLKDLKIPNQRVPEYYTRKSGENCRKHSVTHMRHSRIQFFLWLKMVAEPHSSHGY